jgi:hypothetical protein
MTAQPNELTVTLHWRIEGQELVGVASISDSAPHDLVPVLVEGCELPTSGQDGQPVDYELHLGAEQHPPLQPMISLGAQGVRTGHHLWLVPAEATDNTGWMRWLSRTRARATDQPLRCIIRLPEGSEAVVSPRGQDLTRAWLLDVLKLHNPNDYAWEIKSEQSPYRFVSNRRAHCRISSSPEGYWVVTTGRADVETAVNGLPLMPAVETPLNDGDRLQLGGPGGLVLEVVLL